MKIAAIPPSERPRERLVRMGPETLALRELLAILLRTGNSGKDVLELADDIISEFGGVRGLARATTTELMDFGGLGEAKAATLMAALELSRRLGTEEYEADAVRLDEALGEWALKLHTEEREFIVAIYADERKRILSHGKISWGGLEGASLDMRYLLRKAVRLGARGVMMLHNHPDGNLHESLEDRLLTSHVARQLDALGLEFFGHYVVSNGEYRAVPRDDLS